jgi:hypothetical protein
MLSSDLREKLSQRFCMEERFSRCSFYFAKLVMTTLKFHDHVLAELVVADAPDHAAARHLNALKGVKLDLPSAFRIGALATRLANCEQQT